MIEEFPNDKSLEDSLEQERLNNDSASLSSETKIERIPTSEEVDSVFKELIGKEFAVICKREDEKGIYKYDVRIPGDLPGESTGYEYTRQGNYPEGSSLSSVIDIVYYQKDENGQDIAAGGNSIANWVDGKWEIIENHSESLPETIDEEVLINVLKNKQPGDSEAADMIGKWLDLEQKQIGPRSKDQLALNLSLAEVYRRAGWITPAIEAYEEVELQANNETDKETLAQAKRALAELDQEQI